MGEQITNLEFSLRGTRAGWHVFYHVSEPKESLACFPLTEIETSQNDPCFRCEAGIFRQGLNDTLAAGCTRLNRLILKKSQFQLRQRYFPLLIRISEDRRFKMIPGLLLISEYLVDLSNLYERAGYPDGIFRKIIQNPPVSEYGLIQSRFCNGFPEFLQNQTVLGLSIGLAIE